MAHIVTVDEPRPAPLDGKLPSASAIYRHKSSKDGFPLLDASTLYEVFTTSVEKYRDNDCLGVRENKADGSSGEYKFMTYRQAGEQVKQLASGLRAMGVNPKARVGIFGANCPEWMIAMQACNRQSFLCVPLYDSLGENAIEYIITHAECCVVFVSSEKLPALAKALPRCKGVLKDVVYWGPGDVDAQQAVVKLGFGLHRFASLQQLGTSLPYDPVPPSPEDLCTIMYTSGTTGDPKGVMLTHRAVVTGIINSLTYSRRHNVHFDSSDRLLSYMPLAHIFDRVNEEMFLYVGGAIGYWQGDVGKLLDDIKALKPARMIGVPRVFDRIYSTIMSQVKAGSPLQRLLFHWGYHRKLHNLKQGFSQATAAPLFDRLVFRQLSQVMGGRVKMVVSGGAPLAPHVEEFLRVVSCAPVGQGYGLTETSASSAIAAADEWRHFGTVGPPTPATEMRLESVPEMGYDALDPVEPKGEVLIRGPGLFSGYYKQQEMTDEVVDADGWFHTGDIGALNAAGGLRLIDRKKNIFKLSQGEYVEVEKVEATYKKSNLVDQVWVYGSSFKPSLVAVAVPGAGLKAWAAANGHPADDMEALCTSEAARAAVLANLTALARADKLRNYEVVRAVHLEPRPWTIADGHLTPSSKLKRFQLQKKYQAQVDAMYTALED